MLIQIFGTKKCSDTQKAIRFFRERGIQLQFVDLAEKKISKGEHSSVSRSVKVEDLLDKECKEYKRMNLAYLQYNTEELLLENPLLMKTPVCRNKEKATSGYSPEIWKEWIKDSQ